MKLPIKSLSVLVLLVVSAVGISAQADEFCSETGYSPSLDSPFSQIPYIFGRVNLRGFDINTKMPDVTITMLDSNQKTNRWTIGKSGNYCFRLTSRGTTLIVEVNGLEAARRSVSSFGTAQQREDFEIFANQADKSTPPSVVSAKFIHPPNPKTAELYKKSIETENQKDKNKLIEVFKEIVSLDSADFIAWAKLGVLYFENQSYQEADSAFRKSLELKVEYTPAWVNVGMLRIAQKQFPAAIEILKYASSLEPKSARIFQLLGEAYLQNKQGSLGAESLNKAIELDPIGMAELHLQLAHLYQLAKANQMAAKEYKLFLSKVPDYKDKNKLEEFIKKNP
jgi:tetratricopeptide (TPR) repeat protein